MSGIPIGHISWNFGKKKKNLSFPQVLQFVKEDFQNKIPSRVACQLSLSLDALDALMWVFLKGYIWIKEQHLIYGATWRTRKFLVWTKYRKKFKLLYIQFLTECDLIFHFVWNIKIFSTHHLKTKFWWYPSQWKAKKKRKEKSDPSHEMKMDKLKRSTDDGFGWP